MLERIAQVRCITCLSRNTSLNDEEIIETVDTGHIVGVQWNIPDCIGKTVLSYETPSFLKRQAD